MKFFLLSALNLFVMGSTFVFFSTSIRISVPTVAANFIIFGLAQNASSLFSDSGKTNLAFRQTLKNPAQKKGIYSNLVHERLKMNLPIHFIALVVFTLKGIGFLEWIVFILISTTVVLYSIGLSMVQADESYLRVYSMQCLNAFGFITASYLLSRISEPSLLTILVHLFCAWIPVLIYFSKSILNLFVNAPRYSETAKDKEYFSGILYANFVTLNYNSFLLSLYSPNLLISYTASSMPVALLMPISSTLSTLTSHRFKQQSFEITRKQIFKALYLMPVFVILGTISAPLLTIVLGKIFGSDYVFFNIVVIQLYSAILGLFTGLFGNLFSAAFLSRFNRIIAIAQTIVVLTIGTLGSMFHSILIVAFADLTARAVGLVLAARISLRYGKGNFHASPSND